MTKGRAIELYIKLVEIYAILSIIGLHNIVTDIVGQFVEPGLSPVSDIFGTDVLPSCVLLIIGLNYLRSRMGW